MKTGQEVEAATCDPAKEDDWITKQEVKPVL
jgi:hypothetical protein